MLLFSDYYKISNKNKKQELINERKNNRSFLSSGFFKINVGDILVIFFWAKGLFYSFEGICISIRRKHMKKIDMSLILRNVLNYVGVDSVFLIFIIAYFF
jgi:ribosomal protein L19